jgi:transposase/transposase-like protein
MPKDKPGLTERPTMRKARKNYSPQEKVAILRRHFLDKVSALRLYDEFQLQPTVFYRWLKQFFDNGAAALGRQPSAGNSSDACQRRIAALQEQLVVRESREAEQKWMISLTQGQFGSEEVRRTMGDTLGREDIGNLLTCICNEPLKYRNRAVAVLSCHRNIRVGRVASFLGVSHSSVDSWVLTFAQHGCHLLLPFTSEYCKAKDKTYQDAVFEILHAPPPAHGINRTTWRQKDIQSVMAKRGLPIARHNIRKIIKDAGYRYRKAKKVLTSTDPNYKDKLKEITRTLQHLGPKEKFFSIDEYGPFAIKIQGGRSLVPRGHARTVPQRQRSKGTLIITGALELSTNQITHFYSPAKNTSEMVKLLYRLVDKYADQECIYFSWDAASWHASKALYTRVREINNMKGNGRPQVKLVPLPSCAQFLNVIESVFSGMARAIIHNSDFPSLETAQDAIDKYFAERNEQFYKHPKRAGQKIWGDERVPSEFSASHNCKDPKYR